MAGLVAGFSSLVLETRLSVSGLRNVSSSRRLDDILRLLSLISRPLDEMSLSVVCALEVPVSMCSYKVDDIHTVYVTDQACSVKMAGCWPRSSSSSSYFIIIIIIIIIIYSFFSSLF